MIFFLTSRIVSSIVAFLYPGYASYKTLSKRPASEEELERWLMYWSVLGCLLGFEYLAEWLVSWVPFYYPIKTLFLLYLALPQTQGASYLYVFHIQPFFHSHESQIDAGIASLKLQAYAYLQERFQALWNYAMAIMGQQQASFQPVGGPSAGMNSAAPPRLGDPISGPATLVSNLWRSYGPSVLASGAALLSQAQSAPASSSNQGFFGSTASGFTTAPSSRIVPSNGNRSERKRQLEAELAALSTNDAPTTVLPAVQGASFASSRASSSSDIHNRERNAPLGKFEEIDVPSDGDELDSGSDTGSGRPSQNKRGSWFGWGGGAATSGGYERVKTD